MPQQIHSAGRRLWLAVRQACRAPQDSGQRIPEIVVVLAVLDANVHGAAEAAQFTGAGVGNDLQVSCGWPRFMMPLCCSAKLPLRPSSVPVTFSIAT